MSKRFYIAIFSMIIIFKLLNRASAEPRTLVQFAGFVFHFTHRNPLDYNNYGCWCGRGRQGETVMDEIDLCCKQHDSCYREWTSLDSYYIVTSDWKCGNNKSSNQYKACTCDRDAAQCFARHKYQPSMKGHCTIN